MGLGPILDDDEAAALTPLGEFMQRRNAELGLSVSAVAQRVGMSRATWYRIARGESASPGLHLLRGLARVYKVRAAELFTLVANSDPTPAPALTRARAGSHLPEAGDALWRCRHERQARPGTLIAVELELLNLSDHPWRGAEVRPVHDGWLPMRSGAARTLGGPQGGGGLASCTAPLQPTGPGEWALARLTLRAPVATGDWVLCLALCNVPAGEHAMASAGQAAGVVVTPPAGSGVFVFIATR
jgi:transcriptional regulator with XRE-family HTH domain